MKSSITFRNIDNTPIIVERRASRDLTKSFSNLFKIPRIQAVQSVVQSAEKIEITVYEYSATQFSFYKTFEVSKINASPSDWAKVRWINCDCTI